MGKFFLCCIKWDFALAFIIKVGEYIDCNLKAILDLGDLIWFDWIVDFVETELWEMFSCIGPPSVDFSEISEAPLIRRNRSSGYHHFEH